MQITVKDTGVGISNDDQKKLFKLFGYLEATNQMNPQGIGLGLYISKLITERFGGEVGVESELEVGSTFTFMFKLNELLEEIE